jgi:hypothetical protein
VRPRPPACVRCAYDLTGIGAGQDWATCPECGLIFDPAHPFPRPWPHPIRLALTLAGPSTVLAPVALGAMLLSISVLPVPVRGVLLVAATMAALGSLVLPAFIAWRIACIHAVRFERPLIWLVLAFLGEAYAIGLAFAAMLALSRLSA